MNYTRSKKLDRAAIINKMIAQGQITEDGGDWLTLRLDPYHDFLRPIAGYPDADNFDTVVSVFNYEYNVSKPAAAAANWDAHVFTLPVVQQAFLLGTDVDGTNTCSAATYNLGLVNVAKADAGQPLFPDADPIVATNFSMTSIASFDDTIGGVSRIIGFGVEIIDTTAQLYKQGALTAYKMPVCSGSLMQLKHSNAGATIISNNTYEYINAPPKNPSEAIVYRNSVQWEAKDGAYVIVGQEGVNNPFTQACRRSFIISRDSVLDGTDITLSTSNNGGLTALAGTALSSQIPPAGQMMNVSQQGIFLSGLANDATFKIRVRIYLERAPILSNPELVALASPSAPYDVQSLEMYSRVASMVPSAVPVGFNAKGDWWRIIVNTLKKVAPIVGTVLTPFIGPEAAVIGNAVGQMIPQQKVGGDRNPPRKGGKQRPAPKK
jgi:hypothetical protein